MHANSVVRVFSPTAGAVWLAASLPIALGLATLLAIPMSRAQMVMELTAVAMLSFVAAGLTVAHLIASRLARIRRVIHRLSAGDFACRVSDGSGEFDGVSRALDDLAGALESRLSAARDAERRYRLLYEHSPAGLFRTRADGRVVDCNAAAAKMLGYDSVVEAKTRNAREYYARPEDRERVLRALTTEGDPRRFDLLLRRRDGSAIPVLLTVVRLEVDGETFLEGQLIDMSVRQTAAEVSSKA